MNKNFICHPTRSKQLLQMSWHPPKKYDTSPITLISFVLRVSSCKLTSVFLYIHTTYSFQIHGFYS